eukprot:8523828-Lingulodinium_polyedra.AAC.1
MCIRDSPWAVWLQCRGLHACSPRRRQSSTQPVRGIPPQVQPPPAWRIAPVARCGTGARCGPRRRKLYRAY